MEKRRGDGRPQEEEEEGEEAKDFILNTFAGSTPYTLEIGVVGRRIVIGLKDLGIIWSGPKDHVTVFFSLQTADVVIATGHPRRQWSLILEPTSFADWAELHGLCV